MSTIVYHVVLFMFDVMETPRDNPMSRHFLRLPEMQTKVDFTIREKLINCSFFKSISSIPFCEATRESEVEVSFRGKSIAAGRTMKTSSKLIVR